MGVFGGDHIGIIIDELLTSTFGSVAGGMLTDRFRRIAEHAVHGFPMVSNHNGMSDNPISKHEPVQSDNDLLHEIRDLMLFGIIGTHNPVLSPLYNRAQLEAFGNKGYIVEYNGRAHLNMLSAAPFNLQIETFGGNFTKAIVAGWTNLDLPGDSRLYTVVGDPVRLVTFQYSHYAHGVSI